MPWPRGVPKNMTPEQRVERAKKAAHARASTDGLIKALSKKTPLTAEQRQRLTELLRTGAVSETVLGGDGDV